MGDLQRPPIGKFIRKRNKRPLGMPSANPPRSMAPFRDTLTETFLL